MAKFASAMSEALKALNNIQKELKNVNDESEKTKKKTEKMGEAFKKAFKEAKQHAEENFAKIGKTISEAFKTATKAAGEFAVNAAKGLTAGVAALLGSIVGLTESTEEYRVSQAKLQSAFEAAGLSAESAKGIYTDLYRVIGDSDVCVEAAQQIALLADSEAEVAEWGKLASGVVATFGDALQPETFYEAANETLKLGEATGAYTQMLEGAGYNVDAFNEQLQALNTEEERRQFLLDTSNAIMGEAGEAYDAQTAKIQAQREAQMRLSDTLASLADKLAPITTALTNMANEALAYIMPYIEELADEYGPQIEAFIGELTSTYLPMLKDALVVVADTVGNIISWLADNWEMIAAIAGVIGGIAAAIGIYNAVAAIKAAMDAAQVATLGALIAAYLAQAAAMVVALAPYLLIVAAIAAVIAIIVLLVKHWDEVVEACKVVWEKVCEAWDGIVEATEEAVDAVVNWFKELGQKISSKIEEIKSKISEKWEQIKQTISDKVKAAKEAVVETFETIKSGISDKITAAKESVVNLFTTMKDNIKNKITEAKETVLSIFDGIKSGITEKIEAAKQKVSDVIEAIKGFFNFKFSWPSIPMPHFSITPSGWKVGDLLKGSIPKLGISWYAEGGVFDNPALFGYGNGMLGGLGENGAEAVVPLENNTEWLDKIATMLNEKQGGNQPIYLTVDGKVFAQLACDSINSLTAQRGSIPLKLY